MTIAVPRESEKPIGAIKVEQGISLFDTETRDLWQRDDDFIYYMFMLFNAFPTLRTAVKGCMTTCSRTRTSSWSRNPCSTTASLR